MERVHGFAAAVALEAAAGLRLLRHQPYRWNSDLGSAVAEAAPGVDGRLPLAGEKWAFGQD